MNLTPELVDLHERLRSEGIAVDQACRLAGHSVRKWYEWKERAEAGENGVYAEFGARVLPLSKQRGKVVKPSDDWRRIDYFREWSSNLILDSGEPWEIEDWQLAPVEDLLSQLFQAVWLVVPEGNGKTTLTAGVVLYLLEHQLTPEIPIGSATTTQADTLFRQIEGFVIRSDRIKDFNIAPGVRRIDSRITRGHARVYPHNERSGDGVIPSGWVLDEGHLHPDMRLYRLWKGKFRKRQGVGMLISTAGEPNSEFEDLRAKLIQDADDLRENGPYIRAVNKSTVIHDWSVRSHAEADDLEAVAAANPLEAITVPVLAEKRDEPEMTSDHWLRRTCNIPARVEGQAITGETWDGLVLSEEERGVYPSAGSWKVGFLDLGWEIDTTAMGIVAWEAFELRVVTGVKIIEPPVDEAEIVRGLVHLQREFAPVGWVFDRSAGGAQMAQLLDKGEHPQQDGVVFNFIEHSQDNTPMSRAAVRLDEAIRNRWLRHDGHPGLRAHVLNMVRKSIGAEKWKFDRPPDAKGRRRQKFPIDAGTGLLMGHNVAVDEMSTDGSALYIL